MVNPDFWRGRRVFITGHTGFKGSWLALWLQGMGAKVTGYALDPPTHPCLFSLARVSDGMHSITGDVRDLASLRRAMTDSRPDVLIHMAAQALVRPSYEAPVDTYAVNVMGTVNVLEAARTCPDLRAAVMVTSDKCYENREWVWGYRENEAMGGHDPYSSSKGCAELVTAAYRNSFFAKTSCAVASARAGNVIGGGDWGKDRLLPDIVNAFMERRPARIRYPRALRPWQHVLEPLSGYLVLAERLFNGGATFAEGWNFGPREEDAHPVQWIVERMVTAWGEDASWLLDGGDHPHEAHHLKLDCAKAHALLGWQPRLDLGQALDWTVEWYRAFANEGDLHALTLEQIGRYEAIRKSEE